MTTFGKCFLTSGVLLQVIVFAMYGGEVISLVSGIFGVFAVVLCAQRYFASFIFSFLQVGTYAWLAWNQRFYGELIENAFYAITLIIGIFAWYRHLEQDNKVRSRRLSGRSAALLFAAFCAVTCLVYMILSKTDDTQPLLDAVSTVPAFIAQLLMTFRYREQWYYWGILNIASVIMWWNCGDYCMVAQFVYWTINCLYGYILWKRE